MEEGLVSIPLAIGVLTIVQLWCLHKHFRRHVNPLMVIIFHLSVADLMEGIAVIFNSITKRLKKNFFVGSSLLLECYDVLMQANKFILSVSIVTLATLAVLKMLRVTQNKWLTKLTIKRISRIIWIVMLVIFFTEYVVYKAHGYSDDVEDVTKYRRIWLPVLVLLAAIIIVYCFARMFYVISKRQVQTSQEQYGRRRRFLAISILHLVGFIVCVTPLAVLYVFDAITQINPAKFQQFYRACVILYISNPLVDSIGFLIVYRRKLRGHRPWRAVGFRSSPPERPRVRMKEIQERDKSVLDYDRIAKEECGEIAVVCDIATPLPCSSSIPPAMSKNKQKNDILAIKYLQNQNQCAKQVGMCATWC